MKKTTIGFIGLGKMGKGLVSRLLEKGLNVEAWNRSPEPLEEIKKIGAGTSKTIPELIKKLKPPRTLWIMVSQQAVDEMLHTLTPLLKKNDIIIDGGNSHFEKSAERGNDLAKSGLRFLDVGTSGGLKGQKIGYSMMIGGDQSAFKETEIIFKALAIKNGYAYFGPAGAGHFVKMVHNAIEYGMMQAIGEGFDLIKNGPYQNLNLTEIAKVWNHGSIVRSFLMELTEKALREDTNLEQTEGIIGDLGEGRWATESALKHGIPFTVNSYALFYRYITRHNPSFAAKVVAALRHQFGGHTNKERTS